MSWLFSQLGAITNSPLGLLGIGSQPTSNSSSSSPFSGFNTWWTQYGILLIGALLLTGVIIAMVVALSLY